LLGYEQDSPLLKAVIEIMVRLVIFVLKILF